MASIVPIRVQDGQFLRCKKYIVTKLGNPSVNPIATEEVLNIAIEDALEQFYLYMSHSSQFMVFDYWMFTTTPNQPLYELDVCIDPSKIKSVIYNPQNYSLFNIAFNQNFDFLFFTTSEQIPELTTFYMALQKQELVNKVLGQEGTWDVIGSPPKLQLMPIPSGSINVAVMFSKLPDEATLDKIGWIRRYALAETKITVGEILSRYSSIPGGMGEIQMNGEVLKTEGKEEKEKLMTELKGLVEVYHIQMDSESW